MRYSSDKGDEKKPQQRGAGKPSRGSAVLEALKNLRKKKPKKGADDQDGDEGEMC